MTVARLAHLPVDILWRNLAVDARLAQLPVEVLRIEYKLEAHPLSLTLAADARLDQDLVSPLNRIALIAQTLGTTNPGSDPDEDFRLGLPLRAPGTALSVGASASLDRGFFIFADLALVLEAEAGALCLGTPIGQAEVSLGLGMTGQLLTSGPLRAATGVALMLAEPEIESGIEFRFQSTLVLQTRASLILFPEKPGGFFLLF